MEVKGHKVGSIIVKSARESSKCDRQILKFGMLVGFDKKMIERAAASIVAKHRMERSSVVQDRHFNFLIYPVILAKHKVSSTSDWDDIVLVEYCTLIADNYSLAA